MSPQCLLLKLDVEGEEAKIMPDLVPLLPPTCAVFFESHNGEDGFRDMERHLTAAGFAVQRNRTHDELYVDAFALRTCRANRMAVQRFVSDRFVDFH